MGDGCVLHEHTRLVPIERVPLRPVSRGGPTGGPTVEICAQGAATIFELLMRIEGFAAAGAQATAREVLAALPPRWREIFPGPERLVAYRIWLWYGDAYLRGALNEWARTWQPDGRSRLARVPDAADIDVVATWPARIRRRLADL
jgi:hypothetical protein